MQSAELSSEHKGAALGNKRRSDRLVRIGEVLARDPTLSFPEAMASEGQLEALYRFLKLQWLGRVRRVLLADPVASSEIFATSRGTASVPQRAVRTWCTSSTGCWLPLVLSQDVNVHRVHSPNWLRRRSRPRRVFIRQRRDGASPC